MERIDRPAPFNNDQRHTRVGPPGTATARRGIASVLAMMFLVIFGALAVAMAVVAQGNLRTADSDMKVSRAMSAAETGLIFATERLGAESSRFVVEKGIVDADFAENLWMGTYDEAADGEVTVLPPDGYETTTPPDGIVHAVRDAHLADSHSIVVEPGDSSLPTIDDTFGTLLVRPIALTNEANGPYFRLKYELLADEPLVRVTSQGVDGDITRTLQMDFTLEKKIEYAVVSPNRIMIGKNVRVEGPLGTRYGLVAGELDPANGDPLVMRSDFYYLDSDLDAVLDIFYTQVQEYDVDGDGRLRPDHNIESSGLDGYAFLADYNGDEYVDDFDLFLAQFDSNNDAMVGYDAALAAEMGQPTSVEFGDIDNQLARLIDLALPDRDGDGVPGTNADRQLGYRDGVINELDLYAKVHGRLAFAVSQAAWEAANGGDYQSIVHGPVRPDLEVAPASFEVPEEDLREITTDMFLDNQSWMDSQTNSSQSFGDESSGQVADQIADGGTYTPEGAGPWEDVPFGAMDAGGAAYDFYRRPVYEDMTFSNVRIPPGNNGLFVNCTFIGVTYIESEPDCDHHDWNYAGALQWNDTNGDGVIQNDEMSLKFPNIPAQEDIDNGDIVEDTRTVSNNIRFHNCTFLGSVGGDVINEYTHWRNKLQFTGNTRFYVDPNDPDIAEQDDAGDLINALNGIDADDLEELAKSSILMPGWSLDVGNFSNEVAANPEDTPSVNLRGIIIAGILDIRGTADVFGTLLMTFRPAVGEGPLYYGGLPDAFNTTIGFFGPADGDGEGADPDEADFEGFGEITLRYNPDAKLPDGIPWPIRATPASDTYFEGGSM